MVLKIRLGLLCVFALFAFLAMFPPRLVEASALTPDQLLYVNSNGIHLSDSSLSTDTLLLPAPSGLQLSSAGVLLTPDRQVVYYGVKVPGTGSVDMYRMNVDGTGVTNLGYRLSSGVPHGISPDGKSIAYVVSGNPSGAGRRISIRNIDGTGSVTTTPNIAEFSGGAGWVSWVDSERLALTYRSTNSVCATRIGIINTDGSNLLPVTPDNSSLGSDCGNMTMPKVNRDGTRILFAHTYGSPSDPTSKVYSMNIDGTGQTLLWEGDTQSNGSNTLYAQVSGIAWSVDESAFAVSTTDFDHFNNASLEVIDIVTGVGQAVIYPGQVGVQWGGWFALTSDQLLHVNESGIHLSDSSLSTDTLLLSAPSGSQLSGERVLLSPDRRFVYYSVKVPGTGSVDMYRMNVDGTGVTNLGYRLASGMPNGISPDGKRIAYIVSGNPSGAGFRISVRNIDGTGAVSTTPNNPELMSIQDGIVWVDNNRLALSYGTVVNSASDSSCSNRIGIIGTDGTNLVPITPDNSAIGAVSCGSMRGLKVSKDGTKLLYTHHADTSGYEFRAKIYTMNIDGTGQTLAWEAGSVESTWGTLYASLGGVSWSPDGSRAIVNVFDYDTPGGGSLSAAVINLNTGEREAVVYNSGSIGTEW